MRHRRSQDLRIAVIGDSEEQLTTLCNQAETLGHHVSFVANTGPQAIREMSVHEIDVLISDQAMPGSDGVELMRELQSVHQNVRVVAISGSYLEKSMLPTSKLDGACAILPRPYRLSELADAITGAA